MNIKNIKNRLNSLKHSAKQRGIQVRLMDYEYENFLKLGCHYCGKELMSENGYCLDRVDSNKGYVLFNVVGCCKICNRAKSDMKFDDFIAWVSKAYNFQQKVLEFLKTQDNSAYNYKEEKDLHKLNQTDKSYCIKIK